MSLGMSLGLAVVHLPGLSSGKGHADAGVGLATRCGMIDQPIRNFMTPTPLTIGRAQTLAAAHILMRARRVRHLPVLDGGKLVGLVSQRDLHLVETLKDVDPTAVLVEEAMSEAPYTVGPGTPLAKVAETMVRRRYGSAVIVERGRVVGMFTTVDALRALSAVAAPAKRARRKAVAK
jgi:acetoin utilization protein AcuB